MTGTPVFVHADGTREVYYECEVCDDDGGRVPLMSHASGETATYQTSEREYAMSEQTKKRGDDPRCERCGNGTFGARVCGVCERVRKRESIYGPGTHYVEVRGDDRWVHVKGPWPKHECDEFVARMQKIQPRPYRVVEAAES